MKRLLILTLCASLMLCGCGAKNGVASIAGEDGPTTVFVAGKLSEDSEEEVTESVEEQKASDTEKAKKAEEKKKADDEKKAQEDAAALAEAIKNDTTPPVIEGAVDQTIHVGDTISYKRGVTVTDDVDPNPTLEIDSKRVKTNEMGDYRCIYTATDAAGNKAEVVTFIHVNSPEIEAVTEDMVNAKADEILATIITPGMTDYEKTYAVFCWSYNNITYKETARETDWVKAAYKGMFLQEGDCTANWGAVKCMLNRLGIQNMDIEKVAYGKTPHHYWSLVNLGDGWYHVDSMKNMWNVPIFMWTTEQLMAHSNAHNNTHGFDASKYPEIQ